MNALGTFRFAKVASPGAAAALQLLPGAARANVLTVHSVTITAGA